MISSKRKWMGSLPEGEGAVAKSQRGMTQRMRRTTAGQINRKGKYKHLVWCNLIYVEKKTERSVLFPLLVPFMIHETTLYTRLQSYSQHKSDTMEMKSKLYLRIILLINYMMEQNLLVNVESSTIKHAVLRFSVRKNVTKKDREWHLNGLMSQVPVLSVFYPDVLCTTFCWLYITL